MRALLKLIKTMKKLIYYGLGISGVLLFGGMVFASPSYFSPGVTTVTSNSTATTSPGFMTPGTATTTSNVYDAYADNTGNKADAAVLLTQFTASSTSSVLNITIEYAQGNGVDCVSNPNGCDWYQNNLGNFGGLNIASTSTSVNNTINVVPVQTFTWTFASTTTGGAAVTGPINRVGKAILIPTPARYTRAVYSCGIGGTNCAVYGHIVPTKQQPN